MVRSVRRVLLLCSSFLLCCHISTCAAFLGLETKQTELNHITGHIEDLKKILSNDKTHQNELQEQLKTTELTLNELTDAIAALDKKLSAQEANLARLTQTQQKYSQLLSEQRAILAQQIRWQYQLGKTQDLRNVLNPENISSISRQLYYYHYLSVARAASMAEVNQLLGILSQNMAMMTAQENVLKKYRLEKQNQLLALQTTKAQRQKIIADLDSRNQDNQAQLTTLIANQNTLRNTIINLQKQTPEDLYQSFQLARGHLTWPIEGHALTEVRDTHQTGIIIKAPEGTPVHAIYGGKVIFANWLRGFGLLIIINHGNGYMSLYARNHAIYAKVGEKVSPREVIASIGNTGGYSTSSLYFEIRQNGQAINAKNWCK